MTTTTTGPFQAIEDVLGPGLLLEEGRMAWCNRYFNANGVQTAIIAVVNEHNGSLIVIRTRGYGRCPLCNGEFRLIGDVLPQHRPDVAAALWDATEQEN